MSLLFFPVIFFFFHLPDFDIAVKVGKRFHDFYPLFAASFILNNIVHGIYTYLAYKRNDIETIWLIMIYLLYGRNGTFPGSEHDYMTGKSSIEHVATVMLSSRTDIIEKVKVCSVLVFIWPPYWQWRLIFGS